MSNNRVIGGFEDAIERGQSAVTQAAKQTVKDFAGSAKGQLTGSAGQSFASQIGQSTDDHGTSEAASGASSQNSGQPQKSDEDRVKFLQDLYGKSDHGGKSNNTHSDDSKTGAIKQALGISADPNAGKSPEELAKLAALRNQLHAKYYQELTTPKQREVSVTEKLEREEQIERMDAFEKDKKKPTAAINPTMKQGTAESVVGVSG